jgi:hypothetical protein
MTPDERWVTTTPAEMARLSLESERGPMIVDDLRQLPASPLILAEGTPLLPELVAQELVDPSRSLWLVPTPEFQRARLTERGLPAGVSDPERARENRIERELLMATAIERQARERGRRSPHSSASTSHAPGRSALPSRPSTRSRASAGIPPARRSSSSQPRRSPPDRSSPPATAENGYLPLRSISSIR